MKRFWIAAALVSTLGLTGCSSVVHVNNITADDPHSTILGTEHALIESVNGESASNFSGDAQYIVSPDTVVMRVRYKQLFNLSDGDHEIVRSQDGFITFTPQAGHTYELTAPEIKTLEAGNAFAKQPELVLRDLTNDAPMEYKVKWTDPKSLTEAILSWMNTPENHSEPATHAPITQTTMATPNAPTEPLQQLEHWWEQATEQERTQFLEWVDAKNG